MKRTLFVLSIVCLFARTASAQITISAGSSVREALEAISACSGMNPPVYDEGATIKAQKLLQPVTLSDCKSQQQVGTAIDSFLPGLYQAYPGFDGALHIRLASAKQATTPEIPTANTAAMQPTAPTTPSPSCGIYYNPDPTVRPDSPNPSLVAEWWRTVGTPCQRMQSNGFVNPVYSQASFQPSPYVGYQSNLYTDAYLNYGGLFERNLIQRAIDQDTWGALKFKKGRETFMHNVEVWGCGKLLIQADEANNIWDAPVLVPTNCSPLTFRYTDGQGEDWEVEIPEMIYPLRLQRVKNITLDSHFFASARKRTKLLQHVYEEQPDGSFSHTIVKK